MPATRLTRPGANVRVDPRALDSLQLAQRLRTQSAEAQAAAIQRITTDVAALAQLGSVQGFQSTAAGQAILRALQTQSARIASLEKEVATLRSEVATAAEAAAADVTDTQWLGDGILGVLPLLSSWVEVANAGDVVIVPWAAMAASALENAMERGILGDARQSQLGELAVLGLRWYAYYDGTVSSALLPDGSVVPGTPTPPPAGLSVEALIAWLVEDGQAALAASLTAAVDDYTEAAE